MIPTYKDSILETVEKLRDFNINCVLNNELSVYYEKWVEQVKNEKITDVKLADFIKNQIIYLGQKDRKYSEYLNQLLIN